MSQKSLPLYKVSSNHLFSEVGDEAVILDMSSGVYYGLNETGVQIWQWLQEPKDFSELHKLLIAEYDVAPEEGEIDLRDMLKSLTDAGILEVDAD